MNIFLNGLYEEYKIEQAISDRLNASIRNTILRCKSIGSTPHEPDFIASLTTEFTPALSYILPTLFSNIKFNFTSVFCHQKPIVNTGNSKSPELGDLLLIFVYQNKFGGKYHNSLLLQAKMKDCFTPKIPQNDHQLELYREWPNFKYERAGVLNGKERKIQPKTFTTGAQYLLIEKYSNLDEYFHMDETFLNCALPNHILYGEESFSKVLCSFLKFRTGRLFENTAATSDDWSRMIMDLLQITNNKTTKRINSGLSIFDRVESSKFDGYTFTRRSLAESILSLEPDFDFMYEDGGSGSEVVYRSLSNDDETAPSIIVIEAEESLQ